jgi:Ca2+-dependent lipid-binding protein
METQDPYVKLELEKQIAKSKVINNGGVQPKFNNEELLLYVGHDDWMKDIKLSVWDSDMISDDLIGQSTVPLLEFMAQGGYKKKENPICELLDKKGKKKCGALLGKIEFLPVGRLNIMVHYGKNLRNPDMFGKPDPYLTLELEQGIPMEFKTMPEDELENKKSRKIKAIEKDKKLSQAAARKLMYAKKQTKTVDGTLNPEW